MKNFLRAIDHWLIEAVLPHASRYRKAARRLIGPDEADDLVQEAYARLLASPNWRDIREPSAFMLTIIKNLAFEKIKRRSIVKFDQLAPFDDDSLTDPTPDALATLEARAELSRLFELIRQLPPQCQKVVWMRKIDGMSPPEIAENLGLSISTVEKHLVKGLVRIALGMQETDAAEDMPVKSKEISTLK
jgi:RNA polymerase sigma factor (sigma-70 family)